MTKEEIKARIASIKAEREILRQEAEEECDRINKEEEVAKAAFARKSGRRPDWHAWNASPEVASFLERKDKVRVAAMNHRSEEMSELYRMLVQFEDVSPSGIISRQTRQQQLDAADDGKWGPYSY